MGEIEKTLEELAIEQASVNADKETIIKVLTEHRCTQGKAELLANSAKATVKKIVRKEAVKDIFRGLIILIIGFLVFAVSFSVLYVNWRYWVVIAAGISGAIFAVIQMLISSVICFRGRVPEKYDLYHFQIRLIRRFYETIDRKENHRVV